MVKLDTSKDYYADLELPASCTTEDVKKQFRKLALKYHPDRNPGKEIEYIPRFQAISAAHEILVDAEQRKKYDHARRFGPASSAPPTPDRTPQQRGNPYQARSDFPPPPRRTGPSPGQRPPPSTSAGAARGADRYSSTNFPKPPQDVPTAKKDAADRANMFNAWQNMNHAQSAGPRNPPGQDRRQSADAGAGRPRPTADGGNGSAYAQTKQQNAAFGRNPNQYQSKAPDPQPSQRYGPVPAPPPRPQAPTAKRPDPVHQFRARSRDDVPFSEGGPRASSPYMHSGGGEKTYFSSDNLHRSESTREFKKSYFDEAAQPERSRRRSASNMSSPDAAKTGTNGDRETDAPRTTFINVESSDEEDRVPSKPTPRDSQSDANTFSGRPMAKPSRKWSKRGEATTPGKNPGDREDKSTAPGGRRLYGKDSDDPSVFHMPVNEDTFVPTGTKFPSGPASIDIQFTSSESPSYQFSSPPPAPRPTSQPDGFPLRGRPSERHTATASAPPDASAQIPPYDNMGAMPSSIPSGTAFSPHEWSQNLQDGNWASGFNPNPSPAISPTRPVLSTRRTKGASSRSKAGNIYSVPPPFGKDEQESLNRTTSRTSQTSRDSNAMDIDSPPPNGGEPRFSAGVSSFLPPTAKHIFVDPGRPDSRDVNSSGTTSRMPPPPTTMPPPPRRPSQPIDLDSLRTVPPISTGTPDAFRNLSDLATDLPPPPPRNDLTLSSAPAAPMAPVGEALTPLTWHAHVIHMAAYLRNYYAWDVELTKRLAETAPRLLRLSGGATSWLGGGDSAQAGWHEYVEALKAHESIRAEIAQEGKMHVAAVQRHTAARQEAERKGFIAVG